MTSGGKRKVGDATAVADAVAVAAKSDVGIGGIELDVVSRFYKMFTQDLPGPREVRAFFVGLFAGRAIGQQEKAREASDTARATAEALLAIGHHVAAMIVARAFENQGLAVLVLGRTLEEHSSGDYWEQVLTLYSERWPGEVPDGLRHLLEPSDVTCFA